MAIAHQFLNLMTMVTVLAISSTVMALVSMDTSIIYGCAAKNAYQEIQVVMGDAMVIIITAMGIVLTQSLLGCAKDRA